MVAGGHPPALTVIGTRHVADDGVDVGALGLDFVDVETPPRDAVVTDDAHDDDASLLKSSKPNPFVVRTTRVEHQHPARVPVA
jgi:hypothetical protein